MTLPSSFFNHDAQAGGFYPKSHVGIDVSSFTQKQNILIEGIRGTGKTHVLKMIEQHCFNNFDKLRILPIFVSLAQINEHARKDPDEFRLHLYTHIVRRCIHTIEKYKEYLQEDNSLLEKAVSIIARLFNIQTSPPVETLIDQINVVADQLILHLQYDLTGENFKLLVNENTSSNDELTAQSGVKAYGIEAGVQGKNAKSSSETTENERTIMYVGNRLSHRNAAEFIIEFLRQVQIILNLEYSLILLDECSEADFKAQVEVFRLFKAIRGSSSALPHRNICASFVGTVYPQAETYYPTRNVDGFSFEPGQDCTVEFLQWDETDLKTYTRFFEGMLLNRAKEIIGYRGDIAELKSTIFDTEEAFYLAAYCANGIPRRFWEILKRAYDASTNQILRKGVDIAIQEITNNQILALGYINDSDIEFMNRLYSIVTSRNIQIRQKNRESTRKYNPIPQNIYFGVQRSATNYLNRLIMQGAIHNKARMRTQRRYTQPMYAIDIAIVYTYRIIPQKTLVNVVTTDIPRCPNNDFDQAPEIRASTVKKAYEISTQPDTEEIDMGQVIWLEGVVKSYKRKEYGHIEVQDEEIQSIFFWSHHILPKHRDSLKKGDKVKFFVYRDDTQNTARGIEILGLPHEQEPLTPSEQDMMLPEDPLFNKLQGIVLFFDINEGGFIRVEAGGPNAYFLVNELDDTLKTNLTPGKRVAFDLTVTHRGRKASGIVIIK